METSPAFSLLPEQQQTPETPEWQNLGIATVTQLNEWADKYCRDAVGTSVWDQMPEGQRRTYMLDQLFGERGWDMKIVEDKSYPDYPQSVGSYPVEKPLTVQILKRVMPTNS